MKAALKQAWIAALRSGEYKQGKHRLQNYDGTYCCLGVLCDVVDKGKLAPVVKEEKRIAGGDLADQTAVRDLFPESVMRVDDPFSAFRDQAASILVRANDERDWSFNKIADWIEANIPEEE